MTLDKVSRGQKIAVAVVTALVVSGGLGTFVASASDLPVAEVALTSSQPALVTGSAITFSAVVTAPDGGGPAPSGGTVAFSMDGSVITGCGARSLDVNGTASCTTTFEQTDEQAHSVNASYTGDPNYGASLDTMPVPSYLHETHFGPTGSGQSWLVPTGVSSVLAVAAGAQGGVGNGCGYYGNFGARGGNGGVTQSPLGVNAGDTFQVNVGSFAGGSGTGQLQFQAVCIGKGGIDGGPGYGNGGTGGGASDLRSAPYALGDRLIVGGGGGGGGVGSNFVAVHGGEGGGGGSPSAQQGQDVGGGDGGGGGTQSAGGSAGSGNSWFVPLGQCVDVEAQAGAVGIGGIGGGWTSCSRSLSESDFYPGWSSGGGGGDGYYGGGGGSVFNDGCGVTCPPAGPTGNYGGAGGGGGSSYGPDGSVFENGVNGGNGYVDLYYNGTTFTTTAVAVTETPAPVDTPLTLTASVTYQPENAGVGSGTVDFSDGSTPIASCQGVAVSLGSATCDTSFSAQGDHVVTATYSGSGDFQPSNGSATATAQQAPAITSADTATFAVGIASSFTVTTAAGTPSTTTLGEQGSLPAGVTFSDNGDGTATISGTPSAGTGGAYSPTITGTAAGTDLSTQQSLALAVDEAPAFTSNTDGYLVADRQGSVTITTNGYPRPSISEIGSLPEGLGFTDHGDGTATISGTPTDAGLGISTIALTAHDNGIGPDAGQTLQLHVGKVPVVSSPNVISLTLGQFGSSTITTQFFAGETPRLGMVPSNTLGPAGLSFIDNGDGTATISGTPTRVPGSSQTTGQSPTFRIVVTNQAGTSLFFFSIAVDGSAAITSGPAATFNARQPGSFTVTTDGYPHPALSTSGALPGGMSFTDNGDGTATLSGTPLGRDLGVVYIFTVRAAAGAGPAVSQTFYATVFPVIRFTSSSTAYFTVGSPSSFLIHLNGLRRATMSVTGNLPPGLSVVDELNGRALVSGTPSAGSAGVYRLTVTASTPYGPAEQSLKLFVGR